MSKKRFIQAVVIRRLPPHGELTATVQYAENLWEGLTQLGYGAENTQPRESRDYYADLNERQKRQFNAFWRAFEFKKNRNGAAMRWMQLGELSDAEFKHILSSATKEAQRQLPPGQARKEAQGWLFDKRWFDFPPPVDMQQQGHSLQYLIGELEHVKRLHAQAPNEGLLTQIQKLEKAIDEARAQS
jgi:hypothetical protein